MGSVVKSNQKTPMCCLCTKCYSFSVIISQFCLLSTICNIPEIQTERTTTNQNNEVQESHVFAVLDLHNKGQEYKKVEASKTAHCDDDNIRDQCKKCDRDRT